MVLCGILLVFILSMSALAVDVGALYDARLGAQAALDIGLLSGAQDVPFSTDQASERIATEIRANLDIDVTDAEWTAMWTACADDDSYSILGTVGGYPTRCISFDETGRVRAKLPAIELDTVFATMFGVDQMQVTAEAEAFVKFAGIGGVLPFTVLGGAEDGSQICLRSSSGGQAIPPCEGASSGNFHALQISIYGDPEFNTTTIPCNSNDNDVFTINVAVGIDHLLRVKTPGASGVTDSCGKPFGPNQFYTDTGLGNGLWEGLVAGEWIAGTSGAVHFAGRLTNTTAIGSTVTLNHGGAVHVIDNTPLWMYIPFGLDPGNDVPASCTREEFISLALVDVDDANANIETCLTDYKAGDYVVDGKVENDYLPLLTQDTNGDGIYDIEDNPRFAIVPQTWEETLPRGRKVVTVAGFKAVWVQGLYFPEGEDVVIVEPGETAHPVEIPEGGSPLDQVTGWLLPDSTVEVIVGTLDEAGGEVSGSNLIELIG